MIRQSFLFFICLMSVITVVLALESDYEQPAIIDAQDIEIDFAAGQWVYRGEVSLVQGTLRVMADEIQLYFIDDTLQKMIATGTPANFRQLPEEGEHFISGQAEKIEVDENQRIAIFSGQAKLTQETDIITGTVIIYHMDTQKLIIRGKPAIPGQTTRLSALESKQEISNQENSNNRPKIVLQPTSTKRILESQIGPGGQTELTQSDNSANVNSPSISHRENQEKAENQTDGWSQFKSARVVGAGTAVYSSPAEDGMLLGGLSDHMAVKVLEVRDQWVRVGIPPVIHVWVFSDYVVENEEGGLYIRGNGVRARWLPSTNSRIIGVFSSGEPVSVLATQRNWTKVNLPSSISTWIPATQLNIFETITPEWQHEWNTTNRILSEVPD